MMEQLKKAVVDLKTFNLIVNVVIGETNDAIPLQQAIAQYIDSELKETTKDARADRLQKIFEAKSRQGEKILVIMDDLWNEFNLKDVGLWPLPHGFKILFTSRFDYECAKMGVRFDSIFKVGVLNDTEAKTLFSQIVGPSPSDADDVELQKIGDDIVKKCRGLPIAIVTIAKILVGHIKDAWEEALFNLQQNDLQEFDDVVHKVFELSYNNLKKEDDKAIFLLSGLFPDDFDIPIEDLMRYAWGLKLFTKVDTLERARKCANICVENLISANLLTKSDHKGFVKMHDLVRAFVLRNYSKVKQASLTYHTGESYERILLNCTNTFEFPSNFDCSNLSLLILMNEGKLLEFPKDTSERMKKLEVISYEKISIPFPIEHFTNLRALCLRSCILLYDISFLGSLFNLETLSLVRCNIRRLPSTIGKLKKLKLLDLTGCISLYIDDGVIQNLKNLEELYMGTYPYYIDSGSSHVKYTHANCDEIEKLSPRLLALELEFLENKPNVKNMLFKNLKRFNISIGCRLEVAYSKNYSFKNKLNLVATCNELRECNISDLFEKTEELNLQVNEMYNLEDVSTHHTFSQLKVLHVSNCAELKYLFTVAVASGLNKLERLEILKCPNLKEMVGGNNGIGASITFQKLNFLSLEDLPNMFRLCDILIELPKLVELKIHFLPHFTTIYSDDNIHTASTMLSLLNREVIMIPNLEKLDISVMKNLKQIWPCERSTGEKNDVSMLRKIKVINCDSLVNLFPRNPLPLLNHLEELEVEDCGSIEELFNIDNECVSEMVEHITRLRSIKVRRLKKLNELWRMGGVSNSDIVINCFKGVEHISIKNCKNFTDLFIPTTTNFDLGALNTYKRRITGRDRLVKRNKESGQVSGACWSLCQYPTHIYLEDCDALSSLVPWYPVGQMKRLQNLEISNCKTMKDVFESESGTMNNNVDEGSAPVGTILLIPQLSNLKRVYIFACDLLSYVFTFSTLETLKQLEQLIVERCNGIQVIVKEENIITSSKDVVFLPRLWRLKLYDLPNLKGFFLGKIEFRWPLLDHVLFANCPQLMVFTSGHSETKKLKYINTELGLHSLERGLNFPGMINQKTTFPTCSSSDPTISKGVPWSFHNLIEISNSNARMTRIIPSNVLLQLEKLEKIYLQIFFGVEEVFESLEEGSGFNESQHTTPHVVNIPNLTQIYLRYMPELKYLWKSNRSMVLEFPNLTKVNIFRCDKLEYVFTCSMVGSLRQLQDLEIRLCENIEVIVKEVEEECDIAEVNLPRLKSLKLDRLPKLKGFCLGKDEAFSCPALDTLTITECSAITVFTKGDLSTPNLKYFVADLGIFTVNHGDVNSFIQTNQEKFEQGF